VRYHAAPVPRPRQDRRTCVTRLKYQDDTIIQFVSRRTREVLIELKMFDGALIVWGKTSPEQLKVRLADRVVHLNGRLVDSRGELATIDGDEWDLSSSLRIDVRPFDPDAPQRGQYGDKLLARD
jgi:hypothetical protein